MWIPSCTTNGSTGIVFTFTVIFCYVLCHEYGTQIRRNESDCVSCMQGADVGASVVWNTIDHKFDLLIGHENIIISFIRRYHNLVGDNVMI